MNPIAMGAKLLELRKQRGMTQSQVAAGICDRSHISMLERGCVQPTLKILEKIAQRLQVSLIELTKVGTSSSRAASTGFSFVELIEFLESLLVDESYQDACVLIRKQMSHSEIMKYPERLVQLYRYWGICEGMLGHRERAVTHLMRASELTAQCRDVNVFMEVQVSKGALHTQVGEYAKAEQEYRKAYSLLPRGDVPLLLKTKLLTGLGRALSEQERWQEAVELLLVARKELHLHQKTYLAGEVHHLAGYCYLRLGQLEHSLPLLEIAFGYYTLSDKLSELHQLSLELTEVCRQLGRQQQERHYRVQAKRFESMCSYRKQQREFPWSKAF